MSQKKSFAFTGFLLLLLSPFFRDLHAQTATAVSKAGTSSNLNFIYFCKSDSLAPLEQTEGLMRPKPKILGFAEAEYVLEGERSPIRIRSGDTMQFSIKMSASADPSTMIKLYKFDPRKGNREAIVTQGGPFSPFASKKSKNGKSEIAFRVQKTGNDVYRISSVAKLLPGEYGFMNSMFMHGSGVNNMTFTFFAFGLDE